MKVAIVTGNVAPYANRLYEAYARKHGIELHVFECARTQPGREWIRPDPVSYKRKTLQGLQFNASYVRNVYFNPGVIGELRRTKPDAIVLGGFSPTMISAGLYAITTRTPFGFDVDGSLELDPGQSSSLHSAVRKFLAPRASFGLCSSEAARQMMEHWGLKQGAAAMVPHMGSWDAPDNNPDFDDRHYDLLFCGTLYDLKNPGFFADVVARLIAKGIKPSVRVVGEGPLRSDLQARLRELGVDAQMDGYLQTEAIIAAYQSARLVLFPTRADTWGLVANEAMMCATPIITSPFAVSAIELVQRYRTGLVMELDADAWATSAAEILSNKTMWTSFAERRDEALAQYNLDVAVDGMARGIATGVKR